MPNRARRPITRPPLRPSKSPRSCKPISDSSGTSSAVSLIYLWKGLQHWIDNRIHDAPARARLVLGSLVGLRNELREPLLPLNAAPTARELMPAIANKLQRIALSAPERMPEVERLVDTILADITETETCEGN